MARPSSALSGVPPAAGSLREIYREYGAFVLRTLRRLGVRPADLEDCGQEVFVVVHRKLGAFDGRSLPGWLFSICNRVASDYRKRAYVRHEEPTFELPDAGVAPSQWCDLEQTRAREFLESVLLDLDEDKRDVFLLYELEEMSMPEVATALGCPVQTAYSRHRSAREHLERAIRKARLGHP